MVSFLLLTGIATWVLVPILGIFPLLFWMQLRLLKNKFSFNKKNYLVNLVVLLIIFTVTVFCSSVTVHSDTEWYIIDYQRLEWQDILALTSRNSGLYGGGFERMLFIVAYPAKILSNGSGYWFLFNHSLIINSLTVLAAVRLSKKYYPLILIIVFSTFFYYSQTLYMRQFLANAFLLVSISYIESKKVFYLSGTLSIFSHVSSIIYLLIAWISNFYSSAFKRVTPNQFREMPNLSNYADFNLAQSAGFLPSYSTPTKISLTIKKSLLVKLTLLFLIPAGALLFTYLSTGLNLLFIDNLGALSSRAYSYAANASSENVISFNYLLFTSFFLIVGILYRPFKKFSAKELTLIITLGLQLSFAFFFPSSIRLRLALLILSYTGMFFLLLTESESKWIRLIVWVFSYLSIANFIRMLVLMPSHPSLTTSQVYFQGEALSTNLFDYFRFFWEAQVII